MSPGEGALIYLKESGNWHIIRGNVRENGLEGWRSYGELQQMGWEDIPVGKVRKWRCGKPLSPRACRFASRFITLSLKKIGVICLGGYCFITHCCAIECTGSSFFRFHIQQTIMTCECFWCQYFLVVTSTRVEYYNIPDSSILMYVCMCVLPNSFSVISPRILSLLTVYFMLCYFLRNEGFHRIPIQRHPAADGFKCQ